MSVTPEPALVPELLVADLDRSLAFWCGLCGFEIRYARPEERFAYIAVGTAHLMLEQAGVDQFLVQDPDGYLVRFQSSAGRRPAGD